MINLKNFSYYKDSYPEIKIVEGDMFLIKFLLFEKNNLKIISRGFSDPMRLLKRVGSKKINERYEFLIKKA